MQSEYEKMINGAPYRPLDPDLCELRRKARVFARAYNATETAMQRCVESLLRGILGSCGKSPYIEPVFRLDYGCNVHVGDDFYANFDCVMLDACPIRIGDRVMLGPGVHIYTACHPLDARKRSSCVEFGMPVTIGSECLAGWPLHYQSRRHHRRSSGRRIRSRCHERCTSALRCCRSPRPHHQAAENGYGELRSGFGEQDGIG